MSLHEADGHLALGDIDRRSLGTALLRLLNRYSFGFALLLTLALLAATLIQDTNFGWQRPARELRADGARGDGEHACDHQRRRRLRPLDLAAHVPHRRGVHRLAGDRTGSAAPSPCRSSSRSGSAIGALNGLLIILLRVPPVVATLSMYFVLIGVDLRVAPNPKYLGENWIHKLAGSVEIAGILYPGRCSRSASRSWSGRRSG